MNRKIRDERTSERRWILSRRSCANVPKKGEAMISASCASLDTHEADVTNKRSRLKIEDLVDTDPISPQCIILLFSTKAISELG